MLKFLIRLDDACPNMNEKKWIKIEQLLDKFNIKPIVGIIPDCKDEEFIPNGTINDFWEKYAIKWQNKDWIIAQHGLNHKLSDTVRTEFNGKSYDEQRKILEDGYTILKSNGITPKCFFAPAHRFDDITIKACADLKYFEFISDGYAYFPYTYKNMLFFPSVFDTPHIISKNGIFTFVCHPNNMEDSGFEYLEKFISEHRDNFDIDIDYLINKYKSRKRNIRDKILEQSIKFFRFLRKILK